MGGKTRGNEPGCADPKGLKKRRCKICPEDTISPQGQVCKNRAREGARELGKEGASPMDKDDIISGGKRNYALINYFN